MQIALLTTEKFSASFAAAGDWYMENILQEDKLLSAALAEFGISTLRVDWSDGQVDWSRFQAAIFRTTWDYYDRSEEFHAWLDHVERLRLQLVNSPQLARWNMDKHYLRDLADAGVETIPSRYLECGSEQVSLRQAFFESGWDQAVVKPCVSGAARHTFRIDRGSVREVEEQLAAVMSAESFILQEFQSDILEAGERSLIFFGNEATHAVQKRGRPGDFRVQDDHGGTVVPCQATEEEIEFALRAAKACPEQPVYGRVDFVRDNRGQLSVMELELIEPELWLRFFPDAASRFAEGIVRKLRLAADCPRW